MNFFGHATMAVEQGGNARFVVGAMLPDFASMLRAKLPTATDADVERGMTFHHATDEAFHGAPTFHHCSSLSFAWLLDAGLDRGAARAIAHVGVEILLDRTLALVESRRDAYLSSLHDAAAFVAPATTWTRAADETSIERLRHALVTHGVDIHDCAHSVIADRLFRILVKRPRLAFAEAQLPIVTAWASEFDPTVRAAATAILDEVRAAL